MINSFKSFFFIHWEKLTFSFFPVKMVEHETTNQNLSDCGALCAELTTSGYLEREYLV